MRNLLTATAVIAILLLDWAALDDITTGRQPHYYLEYAVLAMSVLILGVLGFVTLSPSSKKGERRKKRKGR